MTRTRTALLSILAVSAVHGTVLASPPAPESSTMTAHASKAKELPVAAVSLFSSGVGYFQHAGPVQGGSQVQLTFKSSQINDLLKSLVIEDLDGGQPGFVVYPSRDPLAKILGGFEVDLTQNPTLPELLSQLRGAKVAVTANGNMVEGNILGVEQRPMAMSEGGDPVMDWVVNLASPSGVRSIPLREMANLEISDAALREELTKAMETLDQGRGKDKKPVMLRFPGQGERRVRVGYVMETPVWKSSYRLILADKVNKAHAQGWAIVENQTDNDWEKIQLSLISGRPISFVQDLYRPLYAPRPVVETKLHANIAPPTHGDGMAMSAGAEPVPESAMLGDGFALEEAPRRTRASVPPPPMAMAPSPTSWEKGALDATGIQSATSKAGEVGELFQYTVPDITLPRQRSAMIPIVSDPITAEKASIYNPQVLTHHPLNGVILENDTGKHLPAGPVTLFDSGLYAGDAQMDDLPPGQKRLLSYAVDLEVRFLPPIPDNSAQVTAGRVVQGVLEITRKQIASADYVMENKGEREKQIVVEHARRPGWTLLDSPTPMEVTDTLYRFRLPLAAHGKETLKVREERVDGQRLQLSRFSLNDFLLYQREGNIPAKVRESLARAMEMKRGVEGIRAEVQQAERRLEELRQEQQRIHANLQAVRPGTAFHNRMLGKLDADETAIEQTMGQVDALMQRLERESQELQGYLAGLSVTE